MKQFFSKSENKAALCFLYLAITMAVPVIAYYKSTFEYIITGCIFVLPFLGSAIALFIYANNKN